MRHDAVRSGRCSNCRRCHVTGLRGVVDLALLQDHPGVREQVVVRAVVPVQMGVDDHPDVLRVDAQRSQRGRGLLLGGLLHRDAVVFPRPREVGARVDDDRRIAALDHEHDEGDVQRLAPPAHIGERRLVQSEHATDRHGRDGEAHGVYGIRAMRSER